MALRSVQRQTLDSRLSASKRIAGPPKWQLRLWLVNFPTFREVVEEYEAVNFTACDHALLDWVEERIKEELER